MSLTDHGGGKRRTTNSLDEIAASHRLSQGLGLRLIAIAAGNCDRRNGVSGSVCTAAMLSRPCPLWVKSRHRGTSNQCPLYPQKRTLELSREMSALGH